MKHYLTSGRPIPDMEVETRALAPRAIGSLTVAVEPAGGALRGATPQLTGLLLATGPLTALPLLWFASAARRLPPSTLGLFQYLAPTLSLLLAVLAYGEPFTRAHGAAFGLIWCALVLYTVDAVRTSGGRRVAAD
jgi:chloramphenicol-sensitive protein RarD